MRAIQVSWTDSAVPGSGRPLPGGGRVVTEWLPLVRTGEARAAYLAGYLGPAELSVLASIAAPKRRAEWLSGRVVAKRLVCLVLEGAGVPVRPRELVLLGGKPGGRAGKPQLGFVSGVLADRAARHVSDLSLAHTEKYAVCGVARGGRVGVDVEPLRVFSPALRRTVFTERELALSQRAFPAFAPGHRATALWAVKEALLKAYGIGFAHGWGTARLREATPSAGIFDLALPERADALPEPARVRPEGPDPAPRVSVHFGRLTDHVFAIASVVQRTAAGHSQKGQLRAWD
ncbi:4'-phosphopantetheinyl transferase family protein [Streptomyces sp. BR1]|uniref:4'-phosphopantetheinyl transferase family protein n=1 Tax=Streptomyces sp. BR1 TaxID=1592323 RepID=UPI00402B2359